MTNTENVTPAADYLSAVTTAAAELDNGGTWDITDLVRALSAADAAARAAGHTEAEVEAARLAAAGD
ncbi:hypothetical protein MWT96_24970 (plasmid) [Prescottella equi]|uniref:Uncharacterized protein n=1 Tax=Rhodococcus hoagii TaxID=43767 RepID=A0A9Q2Z098_RHOHA|nr:hypothetical protein [Prescottella equi]AVR64907.1 hypothetical protein pRERM280 [Prescottella equi]MBM4479823.1 hypothetical protein [Prescottella equi]MBM4487701.1 hypothetical protein [Prescottella equi]MBM4495108.1 hypothetical protein [Prescottella equi]MBM4498353.1 hypothetical protein [Prescottella equi]